jgi:hypothetical protein
LNTDPVLGSIPEVVSLVYGTGYKPKGLIEYLKTKYKRLEHSLKARVSGVINTQGIFILQIHPDTEEKGGV